MTIKAIVMVTSSVSQFSLNDWEELLGNVSKSLEPATFAVIAFVHQLQSLRCTFLRIAFNKVLNIRLSVSIQLPQQPSSVVACPRGGHRNLRTAFYPTIGKLVTTF